jgi:Retrotransposon gag protein/Zinc knuckle
MSRPPRTRLQARNQAAASTSTPRPIPRTSSRYFRGRVDVGAEETTFTSFTNRRSPAPIQGGDDETIPDPPSLSPEPEPPGPADGEPDGDDEGDPADHDDIEGEADGQTPEEALLAGLTRAVTELARSNAAARQRLPPEPPRRTKVREPDPFDGSDPRKLRTFLVQCELNFRDYPRAFREDSAKVNFATSYLTGAALDWFEPDILRGPHTRIPSWMDDYPEFCEELARNFGPHDPEGDAEHELANLVMREGQRINKYIVEFNRHASQVRGYGEGALRRHFYQGLPDRIKDEISRVGKPASLYDLRDLAQSIDARYWERRSEISRETRHASSSRSADKPPSSKSARAPTSVPPNLFGVKAPKDLESSGTPAKSDLSSKLGKDGKLTKEERARRFDNNLCMVCGKPGHMARECPKSSRAQARRAKAADPETDSDVSTETKN